MKRIFQITCISGLLAASAFAVGQPAGYTGPSTAAPTTTGVAKAAPGAYTGPSSVPLMKAKDLLDKGKDEQHARLQGRLISHKGGEDYEFADQSGKLMVEIDARLFPAGSSIDQNTLVELSGEYEKETFGDASFEVKQLKLVGK
ncbi:MAG: NirD/YgiW/YdeI family stress tolerance protein [Lysobacteraceae bacterium]|nr:MAG: NirD/YgiW/YdeI family stress tolerance protein [Xanthomonadaceae bacterium]